ncbi:MAG: ASPIC/UnbV domain-containing protein, partial [Bacteroidota bacterium]
GRPSNSNGAVYVDLDKDGDLDLVVNNLNQEAFVYRNNNEDQHYLSVHLEGSGGNTGGIGARVEISTENGRQIREQFPNRGYLSSVDPVLHFGLGTQTQVQSLVVSWPDGSVQRLEGLAVDQQLVLRQEEASKGLEVADEAIKPVFAKVKSPLEYVDELSGVRDFDEQPLLPWAMTDKGPLLWQTEDNRPTVLSGDGEELDIIRRSSSGKKEEYIFIGGSTILGSYPESDPSMLVNKVVAPGIYTDQTPEVAPSLSNIQRVSKSSWYDLNGDGSEELIIVGEYLPITIFGWEEGKLTDQTEQYFTGSPTGWWNTLYVGDLNSDDIPDILVGNQGVNNLFTTSKEQPVELFYGDFDDNGSIDPFLTYYIDGKRHLDANRDEALGQLTHLRPRYPSYEAYAKATPEELLGEYFKGAKRLAATTLETSLFLGTSSGKFREATLPQEVQYAPVHTITPLDFDADGDTDLLLCGNDSMMKQRWGKSTANRGLLLSNDGEGSFSAVDQARTGLNLRGDVRSVLQMEDLFLFGIRGGPVEAYRLLTPEPLK